MKTDIFKEIVMCITIARQRLGKHASTIERLFFVWSAQRPLLCNGAVKTRKTIQALEVGVFRGVRAKSL
jgi:hypothetical protein